MCSGPASRKWGRRCHGLEGGYRDREIAPRGKPVLRAPAVCTRPHPFKKSRGYRRGKWQPLTTIHVAFMLHGAAESDWKSLESRGERFGAGIRLPDLREEIAQCSRAG